MALIPFAAWRPDAAYLNSQFASDVVNVLPAAGFYLPFKSLEPFTSALAEQPLGGITVRMPDGGVHIFIGTATKLWKLDTSTLTWAAISTFGADQAVNGSFGADTNWTKGTNVTISGGTANFAATPTGQSLSQSQTLTSGVMYKVTYTISGYSAGAVAARFTSGAGAQRTANGTYTDYLTAAPGDAGIAFTAAGTTTLSIDNVSIIPLSNYAATVDERWRFRAFGDFVVAVNINNAPQVFQIGVSTSFANLAGSPPNARNIAVWGDHLALFDDDTVYWSDTDDITNWSTLNAGSQTFPDGGLLQGSSDATNPIIFQKGAIRLATFVPGSLEVFTFQKIHDQRGCAAPYSIASRGAFTFFADAGAFYQIAPNGEIIPIGAEKVDRTIFAQISGESLAAIYGEVDPFHNRVYFAVRVNSTNDTFDQLLAYDWQIGEWTRIDVNMGILFPLASGTIGYTLDGLDALYSSIDAMEISLDSNVWKGGAPTMGALDEDFKLGFFSGPAAEAMLTTSEMGDLFAISLVDSLSPAVDTNDLLVAIGSRNKRGDTVVWTSEILPSGATGRIDKLVAARFHTFKMRIPAAVDWNAAQGIDVSSKSAGMR